MEPRAVPSTAASFRWGAPSVCREEASVVLLPARPTRRGLRSACKQFATSWPRLRRTGLAFFFGNQHRNRAVPLLEVLRCDTHEVGRCHLLILGARVEKFAIIAQENLVIT